MSSSQRVVALPYRQRVGHCPTAARHIEVSYAIPAPLTKCDNQSRSLNTLKLIPATHKTVVQAN